MCSHNAFKIVYYVDGVMLRQCENCGEIEMRLDWTWCGLGAIQNALNTVKPSEK